MKLHIEKTDEKKDIEFNGTVKALLKKLKINIETVIVVRKKGKEYELLVDGDKLTDNDEVKIISVVSGG